MEKKLYFDDDEIGLARNTSHPNFNDIVEDDFYYDLTDSLSPFGNDTGADTLFDLSEWMKENKNAEGIVDWMFEYIDGFGFEYESEGVSQLTTIDEIHQIINEDELMTNCLHLDLAIIATGFGQLKITGKIHKRLKEITQTAIERQILINKQILSNNGVDSENLVVVEGETSSKPDEEDRTRRLKYIDRLETMKKDLLKLN